MWPDIFGHCAAFSKLAAPESDIHLRRHLSSESDYLHIGLQSVSPSPACDIPGPFRMQTDKVLDGIRQLHWAATQLYQELA